MLDAGEDARPSVERALAALTAMTGILVVAMVSLAPRLPAVVGDGWEGVPAVLLWSGIALILAAPISVVGSGFLYAAGEPGAVAIATLVSSAVWLGVTIPLLGEAGAAAVGIGWIPASVVYAALIWRRTVALTGAARLGRVAPGTAVALAAAGAGWLVADSLSGPLFAAALGLAAGEAIALAGLLVFARSAVRDLYSLTRGLWT
jgi:hypothetical protein